MKIIVNYKILIEKLSTKEIITNPKETRMAKDGENSRGLQTTRLKNYQYDGSFFAIQLGDRT